MKDLFIIKAGTTFPTMVKTLGDFDQWTASGLGDTGLEIRIVDAEHGESLPAGETCAGVVITGSHAMVTDRLPWSVRVEEWIITLLEGRVPLLGVCYGHQLLAQAMGGRVGFHPHGMEIGTVDIHLLPDAVHDPLFGSLPNSFPVHATHSQTVLELPAGAVCLASNPFESHHAYRLGDRAWGVQFHPEYNATVMRSYIVEQGRELEAMGRDISDLVSAVIETPVAARVLRNFGKMVNHLQ